MNSGFYPIEGALSGNWKNLRGGFAHGGSIPFIWGLVPRDTFFYRHTKPLKLHHMKFTGRMPGQAFRPVRLLTEPRARSRG